MDSINAFMSCDDTTLATNMWNEMFLSKEVAVALVHNPSLVGGLITKAFNLVLPWTTTRCAVLVERLCGIAMVAATTAEYTSAVLYSFALASEVDPGGQFTLSDRQAEVAFRLAKVWRTAAGKQAATVSGSCPGGAEGGAEGEVQRGAGGAGGVPGVPGPGENSEADSEAEDDEKGEWGPLPWELTGEPLPQDLMAVLQRTASGQLESPGGENNHRSDSAKTVDRLLKNTQQKVLGLLRVFPVLHCNMPEDIIPLSQQFWALLLELERHLVNKRKEQSLPQSVAPLELQLFSLEDLKQEAQVTKINKAGWQGGISQNHFFENFKPKSYFSNRILKRHQIQRKRCKRKKLWKIFWRIIWFHSRTWKRIWLLHKLFKA